MQDIAKRAVLLATLLFLMLFAFKGLANAWSINKPDITVINPIRGSELGHEGENLLPGLAAQWQTTKNLGIPATWLWQYSALDNRSLTAFAKSQMTNQEFGLFFEIDRNFAQKSGVEYRGQGPWYFSDGLLLVSYDELERRKLIDTAFSKFKTVFDYYPKTVGAWWIDGPSLSYMHEKYGVIAALRAADQYSLDVYTIWGTPWSISYIASKNNAGIPASNQNSSGVVELQWAARDPVMGYGNSDQNSTYSLQDYSLKGYDINYFDFLSSIYLQKPLDNVVIGLENSSSPLLFGSDSHYQTILAEASKLREEGKASIVTAQSFAKSFISSGLTLAPTHYFLTTQYQGENQAFWYNSSNYRIGIIKNGDSINLVDLRDYRQKIPEDFSLLPNSQGFLRINTPAIVNSADNPQQSVQLASCKDGLRISKSSDNIALTCGNSVIGIFNDNSFKLLQGPSLPSITRSNQSYSTFAILVFVFTFYALFVLYYFPISFKRFFALLSVFIPLLVASTLLPSGTLSATSFIFDKKELILLPLLKFPIMSQLGLFILLVLSHALWMRKFNSKGFILYAIPFLGITVIYARLPYFPVDKSTYKLIGLGLGVEVLLLIIANVLHAMFNRSLKAMYASFILSLTLLGLSVLLIFTSRTIYILTPFEQNALETVKDKGKVVYVVTSSQNLIYKSVKPLLLTNYNYASILTGLKWQEINRLEENTIKLPEVNSVIWVPRYLGSTVYPEEVKKAKLEKVFDNEQIVIYKN